MTRWFVTFLVRNTPSCKEMTERISESMERRLSFRQRIGVRLHFLICIWCRRYQKQLLFIRNILRGDPEKIGENLPGGLSPEARRRMKEALERKKADPS